MNKTLIVANWKMYFNTQQASVLMHRLEKRIHIHRSVEVVIAPSLLTLQPLSVQVDHRKFRLCAQNAYSKDEGAYTGEVSFTMLRDIVHYVIVGHSERRIYFNENLDVVRDKVASCVRNEITPILCVGETKHERSGGETRQVLHDQIVSALSNLTSRGVSNMVIAYEPVWAISTFGGELSKPDQMKKEIDFIRDQVSELYGKKVSQNIRVLYGGSVDDQTVGGYLAIEGCNGALVGGASINYAKFSKIVEVADKISQEKREN